MTTTSVAKVEPSLQTTDENITKIIAVLKELEGVNVFDSSVGKSGRWKEPADVYFYYEPSNQSGWLPAAKLAAKLADILIKSGSYDTDVSLGWTGDKDMPYIAVEIPAEQTRHVAMIFADHKTEFSYGI